MEVRIVETHSMEHLSRLCSCHSKAAHLGLLRSIDGMAGLSFCLNLFLVVGCLFMLTRCAENTDTPKEKIEAPVTYELPLGDLSAFEGVVKEQLETQQTKVLAALENPEATKTEMAELFGVMGVLSHVYELFDAAVTCYGNATDLDPGAFRWFYYLGKVHLEGDGLLLAVEAFERAVALDAGDFSVQFSLGKTYQQLNRLEEAQACYLRAVELKPSHAAAHFHLAELASARGEYDESIERFKRVLELQPGATRVHVPLAVAYQRSGDSNRAKAELALKGEGTLALSDPWMSQLAAMATGTGVFVDRGVAAFQQGQYKHAAQWFRRALELDSEHLKARLNLGSALFKLGDHESAEKQYLAVLDKQPESVQAHFNLGTLLASRGEDSRAITHFRAAVDADPQYADAYLNLANSYFRLAMFSDAATYYRRDAALKPDRAAERLGLCLSLIFDGQHVQAMAEIDEALLIFREYRGLLNAKARLQAASPDPSVRDGETALKIVSWLMEKTRELEHVETLAMVYAELGLFDQAIGWQEAALRAAEKAGQMERVPFLRENLARYGDAKPCRIPWPLSHTAILCKPSGATFRSPGTEKTKANSGGH